MNPLSIYSKLFNIPIEKNILIIPSNYNFMELQPNIREIIYTYFHLVNKRIKGLDWKLIGEYMNNDEHVKYIECVNPEVYYENNIVLSKWHKQDFDLINNKINNIKSPIKYTNFGWNLNYYYENKLLTIEEISKINNATNVLKMDFIKINPDLFDIDVIYDRFNVNFNPEWFNDRLNQNCYREKCISGKYTINYNDQQWYSNSYSVLKIILSKQPKLLHSCFEECALECEYVNKIAELYLTWFIENRNTDYLFPKLLQHCKNIDVLFDLGIYIPTIGLESFNYNYNNLKLVDLLKVMPDFTHKAWSYFKDKNMMDELSKYNIEFKSLSKDNCIAFYNTFYNKSLEFYNKVFYDKNFRIDDVMKLNKLSYEQAKHLITTWNEKRGSITKLYSVLLLKMKYVHLIKLHNEGLYKSELKLIDQKIKPKYYNDICDFIIKNNTTIENHSDIELLKQPKIIHNISWKVINSESKFKELFTLLLTNKVDINYQDCKETIYNNYLRFLTPEHIKIIPVDLLLHKSKTQHSTYNQNFIKSLIYNNQFEHMFELCSWNDLSKIFDEIYNAVVEQKYVMNKYESDKFLSTYIASDSKLEFQVVYELVCKSDYTNLGCHWIEQRKCDPPIELWPVTPNKALQNSYTNHISSVLPKEYTERRFYDYMIKNKNKRSNDCTAIYTLFSNNSEQKIIFINDNNLLESPAKKRMTIPLKYEIIKTFFGEELDTNNITMLSKISGSDFDKICGGNHLIDCFVYSDIKNIYRERTPLKQILDFFVNVIQMKFNVNVTYE